MTPTRFHSLPVDLMVEAQRCQLRSLDVGIRMVATVRELHPRVKALREEVRLLRLVVDQAKNEGEKAALAAMLLDRALEIRQQLTMMEEHVVDVVEWPAAEDLRVLEKIVQHYQKTLRNRVAMLLNPFFYQKDQAERLASQVDAVASLEGLLEWLRGLSPGLVSLEDALRAGHVLVKALSGEPILDPTPVS